MFTPMTFFNAQQKVYQNSPDHAIFTAMTHREFAPIIDIVESSSSRGPSRASHVGEETDELINLRPLSRMAITFAPVQGEPEPKTFVDELLQICIRTQTSNRV